MYPLTLLPAFIAQSSIVQYLALFITLYYSFPSLVDLLPCVIISEDEVVYRKVMPYLNRSFPHATSYHAGLDSNSSIWTWQTLARQGFSMRREESPKSRQGQLGYMPLKYSVIFFKGKIIITYKQPGHISPLRLYVLWRNNEAAQEFCQRVNDDYETNQDGLILYHNEDQNWVSTRVPKTLAAHFHSKHTSLAQETSEHFFQSSHTYEKRGRRWKQGWLLSGPAGTGKSTMCDIIGSSNDVPVYRLWDLGNMSTTTFFTLINKVPSNSIIVIEDVDRINIARAKQFQSKEMELQKHVDQQTLLGWMSGEIGQPGVLRIWTTNHEDKLEPTLIRPGRIDKRFHFDANITREALTKITKAHFDLDSLDVKVPHESYPCSPAEFHNFLDSCTTAQDATERLIPWLESTKHKENKATEAASKETASTEAASTEAASTEASTGQ